MRQYNTDRRRGFTLVETVISMGMLLMVGLSVIAAIIYTRHMMEINKQTLTAMNYARQMLEAASTNSSVDAVKDMFIMRFNDPGLNVKADVTLAYYPISSDGKVQWNNPKPAALADGPYYARVIVKWKSMGVMGRDRNVTMSTIVRAGTL